MTRQSLATLITVMVMTAGAVMAQAPQGQGQGARGGQPAAAPRPIGVDVATAKRMVAAAEAAATAAMAAVAIAVVDVNGDLVYFERMDGASARAVTSSQGKARAAMLFGMPTKQVQDLVAAGQPVPAKITMPVAGAWELTPMQGGLPIVKDGKIVGAIGCGGSAPANDEKFAQAGLDVFGK
jgi:glc operon protein GlcG